jgi:hypothetical protein
MRKAKLWTFPVFGLRTAVEALGVNIAIKHDQFWK